MKPLKVLMTLIFAFPFLAMAQSGEETGEAAEPAESPAAEARETAARAEESEENDEDGAELICRRMQVTGTHRRVRRCFTRAAIDEQREEAQRLIRDEIRRRPAPSPEGQ